MRTLTAGANPNLAVFSNMPPLAVIMGQDAHMEKKAKARGKGCRFIKGGACLCHTSKGTRFSKKNRCR